MATAQELIANLAKLSHKAQMKLAATQARQITNPGAVLDELVGLGGALEGAVACQVAAAVRSDRHLLQLMNHSSTLVAQRATTLVCRLLTDTDAVVDLLLSPSTPHATKERMRRACIYRSTKRRAFIDALFLALKKRQGIRVAIQFFPRCSADTVKAHLASIKEELPHHKIPWKRLVLYHSVTILELIQRGALELEADVSLVELLRTCPRASVGLIVDKNLEVPNIESLVAPLVLRKTPANLFRILSRPAFHREPLRPYSIPGCLTHAALLRRLPQSTLVPLASHLLYTPEAFSKFLTALPAEQRATIYQAAVSHDGDNKTRPWSDSVLGALPHEMRLVEASRILALGIDDSVAMNVTIYLPWAEAAPSLKRRLHTNDAWVRCNILRHLVSCAYLNDDSAAFTEALAILEGSLRNEQDDARASVIAHLCTVPGKMWQACHIRYLSQLLAFTLQAKGSSASSAGQWAVVARTLVIKQLENGIYDSEILKFGRDTLEGLHRAKLYVSTYEFATVLSALASSKKLTGPTLDWLLEFWYPSWVATNFKSMPEQAVMDVLQRSGTVAWESSRLRELIENDVIRSLLRRRVWLVGLGQMNSTVSTIQRLIASSPTKMKDSAPLQELIESMATCNGASLWQNILGVFRVDVDRTAIRYTRAQVLGLYLDDTDAAQDRLQKLAQLPAPVPSELFCDLPSFVQAIGNKHTELLQNIIDNPVPWKNWGSAVFHQQCRFSQWSRDLQERFCNSWLLPVCQFDVTINQHYQELALACIAQLSEVSPNVIQQFLDECIAVVATGVKRIADEDPATQAQEVDLNSAAAALEARKRSWAGRSAELILRNIANHPNSEQALAIVMNQIEGPEGKVAVECLRSVLQRADGEVIKRTLEAISKKPALRIASRKTICRMVADLKVAGAAGFLKTQWNDGQAHRDVKSVIVQLLPHLLHEDETWDLLAKVPPLAAGLTSANDEELQEARALLTPFYSLCTSMMVAGSVAQDKVAPLLRVLHASLEACKFHATVLNPTLQGFRAWSVTAAADETELIATAQGLVDRIFLDLDSQRAHWLSALELALRLARFDSGHAVHLITELAAKITTHVGTEDAPRDRVAQRRIAAFADVCKTLLAENRCKFEGLAAAICTTLGSLRGKHPGLRFVAADFATYAFSWRLLASPEATTANLILLCKDVGDVPTIFEHFRAAARSHFAQIGASGLARTAELVAQDPQANTLAKLLALDMLAANRWTKETRQTLGLLRNDTDPAVAAEACCCYTTPEN
eukprot:TRINITY_DN9387_c0_g1_i1.p1 TRINITY_DN9387_c0_g1~~TRINITY_DN9387_c0_g1_i1.p1  ORF type:complete len:1281 (-),score=209.08 TRINITY_DN9387_c0_g1_i1:64-3861(-)